MPAMPTFPLLYWYAAEPLVAADPTRADALARATPLTALRPYFTRRSAALADETSQKVAGPGTRSGIDTFSDALAESTDVTYQRELLASLMTATEGKSDLKPPASWNRAYAQLSLSTDTTVLEQADALMVRFGDRNLGWKKAAVASDSFAPPVARKAALKVMLETQNFQLAPIYHRLLTEPGLRLDAIRGLTAYDVPATPGAILEVYSSFQPDEKRAAVSLLAARPGYARQLLEAVKEGRLPRSDLDASLARQIRLHRDPELDRLLTEVWGVTRETQEGSAAEIARLKAELTPKRLDAADLKRGRQIYQATCAPCHILYSDGRGVGPELTGSNRADLDYILRNIIDPNADIGRDYQLVTVEMKDGRVAAGILQRETPSAVTLVNQAESHEQKNQHRHRRPRLRRRVHPDLPGPPERQPGRRLPARSEEAGLAAKGLRHPQGLHRLRRTAARPRDRRRAHQHADPRSRRPVDQGAQGRQARRLHRADGHVDRRLPHASSTSRARPEEVHDDGDGRVRPRVPVTSRNSTQGRTRQGSSSCRRATSRTWTAGRTTGPACRRCGTRPTASARCSPSPTPTPSTCPASAPAPSARNWSKHYGSPFAVETAHIKLKDSDLTARIIRSLFDVARQYRESIDVYGSKKSFEWTLIEHEQARAAHRQAPGAQDPQEGQGARLRARAAEGIRKFTTKGVYDLGKKTHLSFTQGAGHGGSHPHLAHEFLPRWSRVASPVAERRASRPTGPASASAPTSRPSRRAARS
jgi:putative heme-binding domain-containing protein